MNLFLKRFQETVQAFPEREAVIDRDGTRSTSYRQLYEQACKVNHWLKAHNIGIEKVVAIYYPKGVEYIATRIGVIMAGAAWVGLEDMMGNSRTAYVIRDCGCEVVFNSDLWEEAMQMEPSYDFADPDDHDLAFFIYTSGSTGDPKGAANEYGIYDYVIEGANGFAGPYAFPNGRDAEPMPIQFAHVLPETYVGGLYITIGTLDVQSTIHVISPEMTRDVKRLISYFLEHRIDTTFMTPTFLNLAKTIPGLSLRAAFTGGEIVSNVFSDKFDIINVYGPSEFGYPACLFKLDRPYDVTPIGYPVADTDFRLIDEDGNEADEGELIVYLPWSRGYHHLPELNEESWYYLGEKKYFRTSDIARRDENGCYTIIGRADDMVKINGNRIDPSEIEKAMNEAFNLKFCVVKPVKQGKNVSICAWFTEDKVPDPKEASNILREHLPYYMIPSHYIHIDEIPLNANGKVDKKALPEPDLSSRDSMEEPESREEKLLCDLFGKALKTKRDVGVNEDFFDLGGDSIQAMQIVAEDVLPGLSISMIYEGRCVRNICSIYADLVKSEKDLNTEDSLTKQLALNTGQEYLLKYDLKYPETTMLNLPVRFYVRDSVDLNELATAINQVIRSHPALHSTIAPSAEGGFCQHYDPSCDKEIKVEKMTDTELEDTCRNFVKPFKLDGSSMMRCRVLEGDTTRTVLFDVSHLICDGWSLNHLFEDMGRVLAGKEIKKDYWYKLMRREADRKNSAVWQKDMEYFRNKYDKDNFTTLPRPDHDTDESRSAYLTHLFDFKRKDAENVCILNKLGKNGLYILACALAIADYNETEDVLFTWTWNGRIDACTSSSVGVFFKDLPVAFHIEKQPDIQGLIKETRAQIEEGIAHGHASYFVETGNYRNRDLLCLIYQGDLYQYGADDIVTSATLMEKDNYTCINSLDVEVLESDDTFGVMLNYNAAMYDKESMERFAELICSKCKEIIAI